MRGGTVKLNDTEPLATDEQAAAVARPEPVGIVALGGSSSDSLLAGPASENLLRKGQMVDRYRIVRLVASGGMARVFEAVHVFTHKTVALKVMHQRYSERRDLIERFRHEAMALSSIRHENVVNVENAGLTEDGHVFIAMDLLSGENLREVLRARKSLEIVEALRLIEDVARGVAAAHAINVIHRDLKPENIFCQRGAGAKVLDLGTAKFAGDNAPTTQTAFGKVVGTAAYIAPERLEGEAGDERCDIYSLGLVLYECLAGHHPMTPDGKWPNAAEIATRQVTYHPRPIPGIPSPVANLIAKSIHKSPERRFRSMPELSQAIHTVIEQLGTEPPPLRPRRAAAAGVHWPILLGILVGVGTASVGHRLTHLRTMRAEHGPQPVNRVPAIQHAEIASQITTIMPHDIPPSAAEPGSAETVVATPSVTVPSAVVTSRAYKSAAKGSAAAVLEHTTMRPGNTLHSNSKARAPAEPNANAASVRSVKDDLPASGL